MRAAMEQVAPVARWSHVRLALASIVALAAALTDGGPPAPRRALAHDAYVWQRAWTGAVVEAVAAAPPEVSGLRVLAGELGGAAPAWPAVDAAALARAGRPVTAVVRIEGARLPAGVSLAPARARIAAWRAAGVDVIGLEIDHDSATAALDDYAAWLAAERPADLRWSITALPSWADSPALARVAAAVDELVVQVHAVRAPRIFDDAEARAWIARVAAAVPDAPLRIALPTYAVEVEGVVRAAGPGQVARLVRWLETPAAPPVRGVVWFRLPVAGDRAAWPTATLAAVIRGAPLVPAIAARVVERAPGVHDLVLENRGTVAGPWPDLRLAGALADADLVGGYTRSAEPRRFTAPARELPAGATTVVGWATGRAIALDAL